MIDLTPLDVRNKRGDFKRLMRGYDPAEVDVFLELAAERLEVLVRENLQLRERTQTLQNQVDAQAGREQAVQDALVTAQELRADIQAQSQREADHVLREAEADAKRVLAEAEAEARSLIAEAESEVRDRLRGIERRLDHAQNSMTDLERRRVRFLREFRSLLERELDVVNVEEERAPFEERTIELDLGPRSSAVAEPLEEEEPGSPEPDEEPVAEPDVIALEPDTVAAEPETIELTSVVETSEGPSDSTPADEPTSLERELMAGAASAAAGSLDEYRDVPDLETLLSEAGVEELETTAEHDIAPPPAPGGASDDSILFDPKQSDRKG